VKFKEKGIVPLRTATPGDLDRLRGQRYGRAVPVAELQVDLLKFVASNLAVSFSDVVKRFGKEKASELRNLCLEAVNSGLLRVRNEQTEDPILSITADGSKKVDSMRSFAARVGTILK